MTIPKISSAHGSDTRNIINRVIEVLNQHGVSIQDLVAEGQLTPEQYAALIQSVNGLISKGEVNLDDLSSEVLSAINNSDGTPLNVLSIPKNNSVSPNKTTFFKRSSNLFNHFNASRYKTINRTTGLLVDTEQDITVTPFIPFSSNSKFITNNLSLIAFYDESYSIINAIDAASNVVHTSPSNTRFIRATAATVRVGVSAQINEGTTLRDFELFYEYIKKENIEEEEVIVPPLSVGTSHIVEESVTPRKTTFFTQSTNIIDHTGLTKDSSISGSNGQVISNPNKNAVSKFISVKPNQIYTSKDYLRKAFYDSDRNFISSDTVNGTWTTPDNAYFIRVVGPEARFGTSLQVNEGSVLLPYEQYYEYLKDEFIKPGINEEFMIDTDLKRVFNKNVVISNDWESRNAAKTSDMHALYDALMARHPNYIKRTFLGNDSSGTFPIYRYDFKPVRPSSPIEVPLPKVFVTSGVHPEKAGVWSLYYMMQNICDNFLDDEGLAALRYNFHFIIVPICNPWGFDNSSRTNSNGVDLARNFPAGWIQGTYYTPPHSTSTYGGTAPLSEVEAQYLNQIMLDNLDMLTAVDVHNFFGTGYTFLWGAAAEIFSRSVVLNHVQAMDRKWKKEYEFMNPDPEVYIGHASEKAPGGSLGVQAVDYGIKSGLTYEMNIRVGADPNGNILDSNTITMGYEAMVNFFLMYLNELLNA